MSSLLAQPTAPPTVQRWRHERLVAAGYTESAAEVLSKRLDIDLHAAIRLLAEGCSIDLALRILL